jgi:excisionase family DNA binding protein
MDTYHSQKLPNIAEISSLRTNPPKQLSVAEASKYIGISERTLRSWIAERKIKVARLGGRVVLRLVDVDRFIERHLEGGI